MEVLSKRVEDAPMGVRAAETEVTLRVISLRQDWVDELLRMYKLWAKSKDISYRAVDESTAYLGAEARAYLQEEVGIHRRVQYVCAREVRESVFACVTLDEKATSRELVRSYIRDPYILVKCERTGRQTEDVDGVLAGDLALFTTQG